MKIYMVKFHCDNDIREVTEEIVMQIHASKESAEKYQNKKYNEFYDALMNDPTVVTVLLDDDDPISTYQLWDSCDFSIEIEEKELKGA